jgi:hypothetical protein
VPIIWCSGHNLVHLVCYCFWVFAITVSLLGVSRGFAIGQCPDPFTKETGVINEVAKQRGKAP